MVVQGFALFLCVERNARYCNLNVLINALGTSFPVNICENHAFSAFVFISKACSLME